ncbi:putative sphingolipid C4-monooxygenase [Helianthus debilis subsp. tardiflorus]
MEVKISDEFLGTVAPLVVYWIYSGFYVLFGSSEKYRLHSKKEEDDKNLVSKKTVVKGVLLQQAIQAVVAIILFTFTSFGIVYLILFWKLGHLLIGIRKV